MASDPATPEFPERTREEEVLDLLLRDVRDGRSRALVLCGEPGVGKTALLSYLADRAARGGGGGGGDRVHVRVVRTAGVPARSEIGFAALHELCAPLWGRLDQLPAVQHAALSTALGLDGGTPPRHLLIGLATLGLFEAAAAEHPLICIVDDAQWLDVMSAAILAFVARRLDTGSVALVFAVTTSVSAPADRGPLAGLPELRVSAVCDRSSDQKLDEEFEEVQEPGGQP